MLSIMVWDQEDKLEEMNKWAKENCKSYRGMMKLDVSDTSLIYDTCTLFAFEDDQDYSWFKLRW